MIQNQMGLKLRSQPQSCSPNASLRLKEVQYINSPVFLREQPSVSWRMVRTAVNKILCPSTLCPSVHAPPGQLSLGRPSGSFVTVTPISTPLPPPPPNTHKKKRKKDTISQSQICTSPFPDYFCQNIQMSFKVAGKVRRDSRLVCDK